jgi:hypothetical protein
MEPGSTIDKIGLAKRVAEGSASCRTWQRDWRLDHAKPLNPFGAVMQSEVTWGADCDLAG